MLSPAPQEPSFAGENKQGSALERSDIFENLLKLLQESFSQRDWHSLSLVIISFLMLSAQGCNIMYQPRFDEESGFREPEEPLEPEEIERRRNLMTRLLIAPIDSKNLSRISSITYDQVMRVLDHHEELFTDTHSEDFEEYLELCTRARDKLGILAPDRFHPQTLREVLENHEDVERYRERPVVLVFLAREDYFNFGFQALNVQSHQIKKLLPHYKVLLYETGSMTEVLHQINQLLDRGFLPDGKLQGIVFGAHGNYALNQAGIEFKNLHSLSVLSDSLAEDALLILSNCNSGKKDTDNLANRLILLREHVWKKVVRIIGCDGFLVDVDFELRDDGAVDVDSLQLRSIGDWLTLGMAESTYEGDPETVVAARLQELNFPKLSQEYLRNLVQHGIIDPHCIRLLFEAEISPEAFWDYSTLLARRGISLSPQKMIECMKEKLTPELVELYVESIGGMRHLPEVRNAIQIKAYAAQYERELNDQQIAFQRAFPVFTKR
jgi:hypothetical protein